MKHEYSMRSLHIAGFARDAAHVKAQWTLADMPRLLLEAAPPQVDAAKQVIHCEAIGQMRTDAAGHAEPWMRLKGSVQMPMVCQRCLTTVEVPVEFDRDFRFVASEALAEVEDEESEEDVLVLSKNFDVQELVEDELIMAMPPAPMHAVCPKPVKLEAADADFVAPEQDKPHPFAALQQLKTPKSS